MLFKSHEMKPYRHILKEYRSLINVKLQRVDKYKIQVDELESKLGAVERKAQKRIVAVYKHVNIENERLKHELHKEKTNQRRDEILAIQRAEVAEEELAAEVRSKTALESQRERLMHVHDVLLKYFQKHALWKSDGEDPNELNRKAKRNFINNSNATSNNNLQEGDNHIINNNNNNNNNNNHKGNQKRSKDAKTTTTTTTPITEDIQNAALQKSIAASDAIHEAQALHEHEKAEWKQIHLAMQAMTDSHMAALSDLQEISDAHRRQVEELRTKIEDLEREKAELVVAQGPPTLVATNKKTRKSGGNNGQPFITHKDSGTVRKNSSVPSPPKFAERRMSRYQRRKLGEQDPFEGLAPIVVEILQRRPLPALDADAVIIKPRKTTSSITTGTGMRVPKPPPPKKVRRHLHLHSHNPNSSFHQQQQQRTHNPHGNKFPRQVSRLNK
jgi:hypothetical protein